MYKQAKYAFTDSFPQGSKPQRLTLDSGSKFDILILSLNLARDRVGKGIVSDLCPFESILS